MPDKQSRKKSPVVLVEATPWAWPAAVALAVGSDWPACAAATLAAERPPEQPPAAAPCGAAAAVPETGSAPHYATSHFRHPSHA